jgi:AcrR family transcriptional regulator
VAALAGREPPRPRLLAGEDLAPEPRQRRSADKRARIVKAAIALFGEHGYDGTSIEAIATRAGLAVGGVYQHVRSKRQLLLVLMDDLLERLSRLDLRPATGAGVRDSLRDLLGRALAADLQYLGAYRAWQEASLSDPELAKRQREIRAWTTRRIEVVLAGLQTRPGARRRVDAGALARVLDPLFWTMLPRAGRMPRAELDEWLDTTTHLIYHALFSD